MEHKLWLLNSFRNCAELIYPEEKPENEAHGRQIINREISAQMCSALRIIFSELYGIKEDIAILSPLEPDENGHYGILFSPTEMARPKASWDDLQGRLSYIKQDFEALANDNRFISMRPFRIWAFPQKNQVETLILYHYPHMLAVLKVFAEDYAEPHPDLEGHFNMAEHLYGRISSSHVNGYGFN